MKKKTNHNLRLGILVMAGLVFFIVSIYLLGKQQNLFESVIKIRSEFSDVKGLKIGNNIRFSGINIGTVSDIKIVNDSVVLVVMSIKKEVRQFVRKDSKVEIANEGLMGNKILNILPGSYNQAIVKENDILHSKKTLTTEDLITEAKRIMVNGNKVIDNLAMVSENLLHGNGDIPVLIKDSTISKNLKSASLKLKDASNQLEQITDKLTNGNGDLANLINNRKITTRATEIMNKLDSSATNVKSVSENLQIAAKQINEGNNLINTLLYDSAMNQNLGTTISKVNTGLDEAKQAAVTLQRSWILNLFSHKKRRSKRMMNPDTRNDSLKPVEVNKINDDL